LVRSAILAGGFEFNENRFSVEHDKAVRRTVAAYPPDLTDFTAQGLDLFDQVLLDGALTHSGCASMPF
jgi:hypothetical protein